MEEDIPRFFATIVDAGDGSGDGILEIPDAVLAKLDWHQGDTLFVEHRADGNLILSKVKSKDPKI